MFTLAIYCLTTSNLPWFMDLTFQVPLQYSFLQHQSFISVMSHIHDWALFLLWLSLFIFFWSHFSTLPVAYWEPIDLGSSSFSAIYLFAFYTVHGVLNVTILKWFSHCLLQWTMFGQNSPPWPVSLGWPYTSWFIVSLR